MLAQAPGDLTPVVDGPGIGGQHTQVVSDPFGKLPFHAALHLPVQAAGVGCRSGVVAGVEAQNAHAFLSKQPGCTQTNDPTADHQNVDIGFHRLDAITHR